MRVAHRDARPGSRQQPAADLLERVGQHDLRVADRADRAAELPRNRRPPGAAGQPGGGVVPALRALGRPGGARGRSPCLPRHRGHPRRSAAGRLLRRQQPVDLDARPGHGRLEGRPEVHAPRRVPGGRRRAHVGVHVRRQVRHLRARARRRLRSSVPGDEHARRAHALLRRRRGGHRRRLLRAGAAADRHRELHVAQPERRSAQAQEPEAALRPGRRQLPDGHPGRRLQRT